MGFLNRSANDLSIDDIRRLIRDEVAVQVPPLPAGVARLADSDQPIVAPTPSTITDGQALVFDKGSGGWSIGSLGVIDGSVTNDQIESMSGSKLTTGTLSAILTLTGRLATALTGQRVEIDGGGVRSYDSSDAVEVNITADGSTSTFKGDLETGSLQVNGGLTIDGATNVMDKGSELTLNEGQQDPQTGPTVSYTWDDILTYTGLTLTRTESFSYNAAGGAGGATPCYMAVAPFMSPVSFYEIKVSDGSVNRSKAVHSPGSKAQTLAILPIGANVYEIWTDGSKYFFDKYDTATLTYQSTSPQLTTKHGFTAATGSAWCTDGTSIICVETVLAASGLVEITTFDTAGTRTSQAATTGGHNFTAGTNFIAYAASDGTNVYVQFEVNSPDTTAYIEAYNLSTLAFVANSGRAVNKYLNARGIVWQSNLRIAYNSADGNPNQIASLDGVDWTPGTDTWYIGYVWSDGTHHSKVSPRTSVSLVSALASHPYRGGRFTIGVPTFPSGATQVDTYAVNSSSAPAATALRLQAPTTFVTSNALSSYKFISYDGTGAFAANTNTFLTGTSTIQGTFGSGDGPWQLGGDGTFMVPRWTTAHRMGVPSEGQLGTNIDVDGLEHYDGGGWQTMFAGHDTEDVYDAMNVLGASILYPQAYTIDPEAALGDQTMAAGDCRGATFMVKKTISVSSIGYVITVPSAGAITNYLGGTIASMNSSGDWIFVANTGLTGVIGDTNSTGLHTITLKDAATGLVATPVTLVPGTVYVVSMTFPTYGATQPKVLVNTPAATAANIQANLGVTSLRRNAIVTAAVTARTTGNRLTGSLSNANNIPLWLLY